MEDEHAGESVDTSTPPEDESKPGVVKHRTDNGHYVVTVQWKDGKVVETHFPVVGFPVVIPATGVKVGYIRGEEALKLLDQYAKEYTHDEFSWLRHWNL